MRRASVLLLFALLAAGRANATWSFVGQGGSTCTPAASSCQLTFGSGFTANAGDVVIVVVGLSVDDPPTSVTDDAGSAYTLPATCYANDAGSVNKGACGYCLAAHAGAANLTVNRTLTTGSGWQFRALVFRTTLTNSLDGIATLLTTTAALSTPGPSLTLVGTNDVVVQWSRSSATAITAPYTFVTGFGTATVAYVINTSTAPAPTWTQSTSTRAAAGVIAVKEGGATGAGNPKVDVITENRFP